MIKHTNTKGVSLAGPALASIADKVVDQTTKSKPVTVKSASKGERVAGSKPKARKEPKAAAPKVEVGATGTVIDPAPGEAAVKVVRSIVPMRFKERYSKHGGTCGVVSVSFFFLL